MRLIGISFLVVFSMMFGLVGAVRAVARQVEPSALLQYLLPDDSCPPPCWNGINTDVDTHAQTVEMIMGLPNATQNGIIEWHFGIDADNMQRVRLERGRDFVIRLSGVRLGDWIAELGISDYQVMSGGLDSVTGLRGQYVSFYYAAYHVIVTVMLPFDGRLSLDTPISMLTYPAGPFTPPDGQHRWVGFVFMEAYPELGFAPFMRLD